MLVNIEANFSSSPEIQPITTIRGLSISGKVQQQGLILPCRVRLFEKTTGRMVFEIATDQNGYYKFDHLLNVSFFIIAHHPQHQFNAVIQDNVVPK